MHLMRWLSSKRTLLNGLVLTPLLTMPTPLPTTENWRTPTAFREKLDSITDWTITPQQIVHFQHQYEQAMNLAGSIRMGFFTDDNYATVDGLEQYKDAEEKLREEIKVYQSIYLTIAEEHRKRRPGEDPLALDVLDPIDPNL